MLVRVRSNVGVWRVQVSDDATVASLKEEIQKTRPSIIYEKDFCFDPGCKESIAPELDLADQGISHGSMIHCRVDPKTVVSTEVAPPGEASSTPTAVTGHFRKVIDKDGSIHLIPSSEANDPSSDKGFRKGQLALRDMKMHWTLTDFVALDSQYEFKLKRQDKAFCRQVSLDIPSVGNFQSYIQNFGFQRKRFGYLYGKYVPTDDEEDTSMKADQDEGKQPMKVIVEAIYEPPQDVDDEAAEGFVALDDEKEETVEMVANMLGLQKVGWIFGHEERSNFTLTAAEVLLAAEYQLEDAKGVHETPFVTVTVSPTVDGTVTVEAFQVSLQCMSMVAEEALEIGENPSECSVNETFTAIQEGKASKTVENSFFLTVVPIVQHTSEMFIADFPMINRDVSDRTPSHDEMKRQLQKSGTEGWTFVDRLADFNLLIYLSGFLDLNADLPKICASIVDRTVPLDSGYQIIIKSLAGLDGSY